MEQYMPHLFDQNFPATYQKGYMDTMQQCNSVRYQGRPSQSNISSMHHTYSHMQDNHTALNPIRRKVSLPTPSIPEKMHQGGVPSQNNRLVGKESGSLQNEYSHMQDNHTALNPIRRKVSLLTPSIPETMHQGGVLSQNDRLVGKESGSLQNDLLQCSECSRTFSRTDILRRHILTQDRDLMEFSCRECEKKFRAKWDLQRHENICHSVEEIACKDCPMTFKSAHSLRWHRIKAHDCEAPYKCSFCKRDFVNSANYKGHLRKHKKAGLAIEVDDLKCSHCDEIFQYSNSLQHHVAVCSGEKQKKSFKCPTVPCEKSYSDEKGLKIHIRAAHEKKRHNCEQCNKTFAFKSGLLNHRKICALPLAITNMLLVEDLTQPGRQRIND
eukprot:Seg978.1 transcript_id=Seg978.1/GoldUCD/mRNA.D3Y31 product="PR domain zinc finger protein 5" protein_id=Seg978.1/GoldUCD/D3Y31